MAQGQGKLGRQGTAQSLRGWITWPVITVVQAWQNSSEDMTLSGVNLEFDPRNVRSQSQAAEPEIIHLKHMIQFSESSAFSPRKPQISGLDLLLWLITYHLKHIKVRECYWIFSSWLKMAASFQLSWGCSTQRPTMQRNSLSLQRSLEHIVFVNSPLRVP